MVSVRVGVAFALVLGCTPPANAPAPRSTMIIGLDVSGSFRSSGHFDDAVEFASLYIYGHMKGFHDLRRPTDVFVGTMGGQRTGEAKTFHPIQDLSGKSPAQISASLKAWFGQAQTLRTDALAAFRDVVAAARGLPVVFLSGGVPFPMFEASLRLAHASGAPFAGFMCGRALWSEAVAVFGAEGEQAVIDWLMITGRDRLARLIAATGEHDAA